MMVLFTGYGVKREDFSMELSNRWVLKNAGLISTAAFIIRYVTPFLLMLVFLNSVALSSYDRPNIETKDNLLILE